MDHGYQVGNHYASHALKILCPGYVVDANYSGEISRRKDDVLAAVPPLEHTIKFKKNIHCCKRIIFLEPSLEQKIQNHTLVRIGQVHARDNIGCQP